jgi:hypothetical protein
MIDAFATAGFQLSVISEPQPDTAARDVFPDGFRDLSTKPCFLFFVVEVPSSEFDKATKLLGSFHSGIRHA